MSAVASAEAPEYRYCEGCDREFIAELVSASSYEANGIGDTVQCSWCMGHNPAYIRDEAESAVTVVDHPGEMGPHYCPAGCAASDRDDHEEGCEWRCASPGCREELGSSRERQCGVCIDHDDDAPGYTSRGDAHLMAVTAPGAR